MDMESFYLSNTMSLNFTFLYLDNEQQWNDTTFEIMVDIDFVRW